MIEHGLFNQYHMDMNPCLENKRLLLTVGILRGVTLLETTIAALSKGVYARLKSHKKTHEDD